MSSQLLRQPQGKKIKTNLQSPPPSFPLGEQKKVCQERLHDAQEPRILSWSPVTIATIQGDISLPCNVEGNPRPEIYWRNQDNVNVAADPRFQVRCWFCHSLSDDFRTYNYFIWKKKKKTVKTISFNKKLKVVGIGWILYEDKLFMGIYFALQLSKSQNPLRSKKKKKIHFKSWLVTSYRFFFNIKTG